jgi:hypothetical protein
VLGRFRLVDRVADSGGSTFWRAHDERLKRPVGVRLMALDHPGVDTLRTLASEATLVTDRRAVPVLDIADDHSIGQLVIITEWLVGTPLGTYLASRAGDPLSAREAGNLTLEVARFLTAAEEAGVAHGHVRPNAVMVTDTGEVRVRGLGIDRALYGVDPDIDPALADVHGAGSILFAALTGRWPGPAVDQELPGVPTVSQGRTPWPSRVVADVPPELDAIVARSLATTALPKGLTRFTHISEVSAALSSALSAPPAIVATAPRRSTRRVVSVVLGVVSAIGLGALGIALVQGMGGTPLTTPRAAVVPTSAAPSTSSSAKPTGTERVIPIVSATDIDPYGDTGEENPQLARLAIDGDESTAWKTVRYRTAELSGKPGVGLLLDLGAPRPVAVVQLRLVGNGTDISLRASDNATLAPEKFTSMAEATGAGGDLTLRVLKPVTTRYLLVWLTLLPWEDGAYQGGISDVRVRG